MFTTIRTRAPGYLFALFNFAVTPAMSTMLVRHTVTPFSEKSLTLPTLTSMVFMHSGPEAGADRATSIAEW
jgi:hypothetical protein